MSIVVLKILINFDYEKAFETALWRGGTDFMEQKLFSSTVHFVHTDIPTVRTITVRLFVARGGFRITRCICFVHKFYQLK